jgi:hypothetical protein
MTSGHFRDVLKAQPFRPFRLHMGDGRALDVPHQDFIALHPTGRVAIVFGPNDHFDIVDLMLVTSIEVGNGSRRRRRS